ncbi:NAB domain-containing protein [Citrus sinensis]|uniref:NAB domain-containing protein n=2 Tax=Citrus sinensis TaxID=2711 RepID=A0ACB8L2K1_CITSI|nr:NAB domain-containing protein [Citrus sinensis]
METDMKQTESKESRSSSRWLAENLEEMDRSVKQMQKLIEDGESLSKFHRPELTAHIEDFYHLYQSLVERYDHLTGELQKNVPSDIPLQGSGKTKSGFAQGSPLLTPDRKMGLHNTSCQATSSTSGGSSNFSLKEGAELSSPSSSDSESEFSNSSVKIHRDAPINMDGKELTEEANETYEELLGRVIQYEDKLRVLNLSLQLSEEEVARLKSELHSQIESAKRDVNIKEADLEMERRQVFELQNYVRELETRLSESNFEIERLMKELEVSSDRLKGSDEEINRLNNQLANEISEGTHQLQGQLKLAQDDVTTLNAKLDYERMQVLKFQERIAKVETNLSDRNNEVAELKIALSDAEEKFTLDKAQLQSEMFCLLEKQAHLDARLKEWELQGKALEDKIRQCETEKMEIIGLHEAQERGMQSEINQLKVEVCERGNHIEALNKIMDSLKLKYDMLMAEKDEINAKVNTLMAEARSRDNHIGQIEEHSRKLHMEHEELIAASESSRKLVDELRFRVKELENEVDRQRMVILDAAEEKREAIRQLCFSLEHYRSGYQELRQAFLGYKRPAVMAA